MKNKPLLLVLAIAVPLLAYSALAFDGQGLFEVLRRVNIEQTYHDFSLLVDLALYLLLFIPLSLFSLGRHFRGREGRMISAAVGLILSLGLVLVERTLDFNIKSFGPLSALMLVGGVAVVVFVSLKRLGVRALSAACGSIVLLYFSIQSVSPGFYGWLLERMPWTPLVLLASIFIVVVQGLRKLITWSREGVVLGKTGNAGAQERIQRQENATKIISRAGKMKHKEAKRLVKELKNVRSQIISGAPRRESIRSLRGIEPEAEELLAHAQIVKQLAERLWNLDLAAYRELKKHYQGAALWKMRLLLKKEIHAELRKLRAEKRLKELEALLERRILRVKDELQRAARCLSGKNDHEAVMCIDQAIEHALEIDIAASNLKALNRQLRHLMKKERRFAKLGAEIGRAA